MPSTQRVCLPRLFVFLVVLIASPLLQADTYRILISNDDGYNTPEIRALRDALLALPDTEVLISAPARNQSGASHSAGGTEMTVERLYEDGTFIGYSVDGTPSDAVRFGILTMGQEQAFDMVVSGINQGANIGNVSHLSGTVGAAMAAQYLGLPSIAVSQETRGVDTAASAAFAARVVSRLREYGAPEGVVLSINIPAGETRGVKVMPMGDSYLITTGYTVLSEEGNTQFLRRERGISRSTDESTDTHAYQNGYITITPLRFDWTAHELIEEISSWGLQ